MFEDIFAQYSRLGITKLDDRPVAISGLESRLADFYHTKSIYGVLVRFLHRSLLWKRSGNTVMQPINFRDERVPSWSWMAYSGEIQYGTKQGWHRSAGTTLSGDLSLDAQNRRILAPIARISQGLGIGQEGLLRENGNLVGWIRFDRNDKQNVETFRCVVIGQGTTGWKDYVGVSWDEELIPGEFYYVMLVAPAHREQGDKDAYQRRGVAIIHGGYLSFSELRSKAAVI